jgi:hypothetical protein
VAAAAVGMVVWLETEEQCNARIGEMEQSLAANDIVTSIVQARSLVDEGDPDVLKHVAHRAMSVWLRAAHPDSNGHIVVTPIVVHANRIELRGIFIELLSVWASKFNPFVMFVLLPTCNALSGPSVYEFEYFASWMMSIACIDEANDFADQADDFQDMMEAFDPLIESFFKHMPSVFSPVEHYLLEAQSPNMSTIFVRDGLEPISLAYAS